MKTIKIENTDVFLEDIEFGKGKITISDTFGYNYSMYWGSMGSDLKDFLLRIDSDYFASKLIPVSDERVIDVKQTFKNLRKFIREELDLPFYREMEFQKQLREAIKEFQNECEEYGGKYCFVDRFFSGFVDNLNFYLIKKEWERDEIKNNFEGISEHWHFLEEKPSECYQWLIKFHGKLKKKLASA